MTYNSLPPGLCPSGIRAQIVSSLTKSQKDDIEKWKILNRTFQVAGMERFVPIFCYLNSVEFININLLLEP